MVYRIRPMQETKVDFENRPYKLGETIHIRVELNPRRDLDVREVRVELICEAIQYYRIGDIVGPSI